MKIPPQVKRITDFIFEKCSKDMGSVLIWTTIGGWVASSAAQIFAIKHNSKYTKEQKSFMIPQEISDAAVNIGAFFLITTPIKKLSTKLVTTGKIIPNVVRRVIIKNNDKCRIGKLDFNITKTPYFGEVEKTFNSFHNFMTTSAAVLGGVISSNIVTPILRNRYASQRQAKKQALFNQSNVVVGPINPIGKDSQSVSTPYKPRVSNNTFDKFRGKNLTV